jgi:hypothetical protein
MTTTVRRSRCGCRGCDGPWPILTIVERAEPPIGAARLARDGRPAMGADMTLHAPALALRILLVRQGWGGIVRSGSVGVGARPPASLY